MSNRKGYLSKLEIIDKERYRKKYNKKYKIIKEYNKVLTQWHMYKKHIKIDNMNNENLTDTGLSYILKMPTAFLKRKYRTAFCELTSELYDFEHWCQLRYIREYEKYKQYLPLNDVEYDNDRHKVKDIIKAIEELRYVKDRDTMKIPKIPTFDTYRSTTRRHLEAMLDSLIGKKNSINYFKNENNKFYFNKQDYDFFNFLIDNFDTDDAFNIRKKKFDLVAPRFLNVVRLGLDALLTYHKTSLNKYYILNRIKIK